MDLSRKNISKYACFKLDCKINLVKPSSWISFSFSDFSTSSLRLSFPKTFSSLEALMPIRLLGKSPIDPKLRG